MAKKQISIREPYATLYHDFPFAVGDELTIDGDGNTGIVEDAIWEGDPDAPATSYKVTYHIKIGGGQTHELQLNEVLRFNERSDSWSSRTV